MGNVRRLVIVAALLALPSAARAQVGGMSFYNGSTFLGHATAYKADGTSLTCSISGSTVTCSAAGGIGGTISTPHMPYATSADQLGDTDFEYATAAYAGYTADLFQTTTNQAMILRANSGNFETISFTLQDGNQVSTAPRGAELRGENNSSYVELQFNPANTATKRIRMRTTAGGYTTFSGGTSQFEFYDGTSYFQSSEFGTLIQPEASASGTQTSFEVVNAAATGQTASTEIPGILFNLSATRTWATGAIALQREFRIQNPRYSFASASTITTAATMSIDGIPIAGTNASITNEYPLLIYNNSIGNVTSFAASEGVSLQNTTAATAILLQYSPMLELIGQGWETGTGGASQQAAWAIQNQPGSTGGSTVVASLILAYSVNSGAYQNQFAFSSAGIFDRVAGTLNLGGSLSTAVSIGKSNSNTSINGKEIISNGVNQGTALIINGAINTAGVTPSLMQITAGASTGQTASTELTDVLFDLSATRTFAAGAIATDRAFRVVPPTYAFASASTITTAATVAIDGDPVAATNATITESIPLLVSNNNIGATSTIAATEGVVLENSTAAAAGAQQFSPMLVLDGQGWSTTNSQSMDVRYLFQTQPIQGAAAPSSNLLLYSSINGAALTTIGTWTSAGTFQANGTINTNAGGNGRFNGQVYDTLSAVAISFGTVTATGVTLGKSTTVVTIAGQLASTGTTFASLGTPANGTLIYCSDCTIANPCAGSGTGAFAKRLNSTWVCN